MARPTNPLSKRQQRLQRNKDRFGSVAAATTAVVEPPVATLTATEDATFTQTVVPEEFVQTLPEIDVDQVGAGPVVEVDFNEGVTVPKSLLAILYQWITDGLIERTRFVRMDVFGISFGDRLTATRTMIDPDQLARLKFTELLPPNEWEGETETVGEELWAMIADYPFLLRKCVMHGTRFGISEMSQLALAETLVAQVV